MTANLGALTPGATLCHCGQSVHTYTDGFSRGLCDGPEPADGQAADR